MPLAGGESLYGRAIAIAVIAYLRSLTKTPILTGEDIYLADGFRELFEKRAVAIAQPDVSHCGGISEARRIAANIAKLPELSRKDEVIADCAVLAPAFDNVTGVQEHRQPLENVLVYHVHVHVRPHLGQGRRFVNKLLVPGYMRRIQPLRSDLPFFPLQERSQGIKLTRGLPDLKMRHSGLAGDEPPDMSIQHNARKLVQCRRGGPVVGNGDLPGTGDATSAPAACYNRCVAGHAAPGREDALGGVHPVDVLGRGFDTH